MFSLRPYQSKAVDQVREAFRAGRRRPLLVAPTGSGKTVIFSYVTANAAAKGNRTLVLVHRAELLNQTHAALSQLEVPHGLIAAGKTPDSTQLTQVASVQTLIRRLDHVRPPDLIVIDECFPAATLVDGRPIESIRAGDSVASFNHESSRIEQRNVLGVMKRKYHGAWYRLTDGSGRSFVCTENHPIFILGRGYVSAKCLTLHDAGALLITYEMPILRNRKAAGQKAQKSPLQVLRKSMPQGTPPSDHASSSASRHEMHDVREGCRAQGQEVSASFFKDWPGVLFKGLFGFLSQESFFNHGDKNKHKIKGCHIKAHEGKKSNEVNGQRLEDDQFYEGKNIPFTRGEWTEYKATDCHSYGVKFADGVSDYVAISDRIQEPSKVLQGGPCRSVGETCNRSGWEIAQAEEVEIFGQKKDGGIGISRLESVEVYERGSGPRPEWVPISDFVHNIHVEGNNNYFAEGILVHNCHHATAGAWATVLARWPEARVLGVTATPQRLDGKGLGQVFDDLIRGPEVADLISQGFLCRPQYFAPKTVSMDGVHKTAGDYNRAEIAERMDKPTITGDAVTHYRKYADGLPCVVFCTGIKHAEHVCQAFNSAGYRFAVLDGTLSPEERAARVLSLGNGKLHGLVTVDIVSEGFDLPIVACAILLRPTASLSLHLQQVGRVLRVSPGKPRAIILDHVGNCRRHGLAEEVRDWSLDGIRRKGRKGQQDDVQSTRQCPQCFAVHTPSPTCPQCLHVYEVKDRIPDVVDGELEELKARQAVRERKREQGTAQTLEDLIRVGKARGMNNPYGWAHNVFKARQKK